MEFLFVLAVVLFICGVGLILLASYRQKKSGLPAGRIIYTDTSQWQKIESPLFDSELQLTGKPDYLVENQDGIIPIEIKSGRGTEAPYDSHIFQLAAYCRLVEKIYGVRPPYGIIHYPQRTFSVEYTPELEKRLLILLDNIRERSRQAGKRNGNVDRSHQSADRCRRCGYRDICSQAMQ
jgi:CRISPR-associated exonuclease Cas4